MLVAFNATHNGLLGKTNLAFFSHTHLPCVINVLLLVEIIILFILLDFYKEIDTPFWKIFFFSPKKHKLEISLEEEIRVRNMFLFLVQKHVYPYFHT